MMVGKRPREPIGRTTSMTGINADLNDVEASEPFDYPHQNNHVMNGQGILVGSQLLEGHGRGGGVAVVGGPSSGLDRNRLMAMVSPRYKRRSSGGGERIVMETPQFLKTRGLCQRRLTPGRDLYMYRGDTAFCSQECREQQMKHDEKKEKHSMAANSDKDENHHHHHPPPPPARQPPDLN